MTDILPPFEFHYDEPRRRIFEKICKGIRSALKQRCGEPTLIVDVIAPGMRRSFDEVLMKCCQLVSAAATGMNPNVPAIVFELDDFANVLDMAGLFVAFPVDPRNKLGMRDVVFEMISRECLNQLIRRHS